MKNSFYKLVIFITTATVVHTCSQPHRVNQYFSIAKTDCLDWLWESISLTHPNKLDMRRVRATGQMPK